MKCHAARTLLTLVLCGASSSCSWDGAKTSAPMARGQKSRTTDNADTVVAGVFEIARVTKTSSEARDLFGKRIAGVDGVEFWNPPYDSSADAQRRWAVTMQPGISARRVCRLLGLKRAYLVSGYVEQVSFSLAVWKRDVPDQYSKRIYATAPVVHGWTLEASGKRPPGELPALVAGASPAYDVEKYDTLLTHFEFTRVGLLDRILK